MKVHQLSRRFLCLVICGEVESANCNFGGARMGHKYFLCYGLAGAVPPTEATETPETKQADRQETTFDAGNSEGTFAVHFITQWPA